MGIAKRTPEGKLRHQKLALEIKRKKRLTPEFRAKEALAARERYHKNKERGREIAKKWARAHQTETTEKRRQWRLENPSLASANYRKWRKSGIKYYAARLRDGSISIEAFYNRVRELYEARD